MSSYAEQLEAAKAEQQGKSKEEIMEQVKGEFKLDLDSLPKQQHNWVQRGIVVSCEGAGHPNHRHFLSRPMTK